MFSNNVNIADIEANGEPHGSEGRKNEPSQFQELLREYCPGRRGFLAMWVDGFPQRIRKVKHKRLQNCCGSFLQIGFIAIFGSLVYTTYTSNVNAAFLSLSKKAGTCSTVPITTTRGLLLDTYGNWETESSFVRQEALYYIKFSEYDADDSSWKKDMENINSVIFSELDFLSGTDDYALKILHLSSWRETIEAKKGGTITVWFYADPGSMFDFQDHNFEGHIGNPSDVCRKNNAWRYSDGKYTITFKDVWNGKGGSLSETNPGNFTSTCASFDPVQLGFSWDYPTKDFNLIVDIRSTLTAVALNMGIISQSDLLTVSDVFYEFTDLHTSPVAAMYDPKFQSMTPIYLDDAGTFIQRVGNSGFVPSFKGFLYADTVNMGSEPNPWLLCPATCETSSLYCSAPGFQIEYRPPTLGAIAEYHAGMGYPGMEFGIDAYTDELYVLNDAKMDPGYIACKTSQVGSSGKLGNLQPIPSTEFLSALESTKPFKLAESYYFCYPNKVLTFIDSFGIAQGNASMLFTLLLMTVILSLSAMNLLHRTVTQNDMEDTMLLLAEVVKLHKMGAELREPHKEVLAILHRATASSMSEFDSPVLSFPDFTVAARPAAEAVKKAQRQAHDHVNQEVPALRAAGTHSPLQIEKPS